MDKSANVSILILTLNEEENIGRCLKSVSWSDDVVVLDSLSTDRTQQIAQGAGARIVKRRFDNYAAHRNYGLNEIDHKHDWVMMVDADEMMTYELAREVNSVVENCTDEMCLYCVRRKDYFMGKWINHSSGYPTWFGRLAKIGRVRVERAVNEEYHTDGKIGFLKEHLLHYPFNKGFYAWLKKHNRYSTMEAEMIYSQDMYRFQLSDLKQKDPTIRRKALKALVYRRLPCRPLIVFGYLYFLRRGFMDGRSGLTFCLLKAFYEYMIDCKVKEFQRREAGLPL